MDFGDLIILLFLVFPIIGRVLSNLRKRSSEQIPVEPTEKKETFFDRAIREIESALEEKAADGQPDVMPSPARKIPTEDRSRSFQLESSFEDETVQMDDFHAQSPESFESLQFTEFRELKSVEVDKDLAETFDFVKKQRGSQTGKRIRGLLQGKTSVRDAFVISEILGPPPRLRSGSR